VMRASPPSSLTRRTQCARITREHARKLPRRCGRANTPSAGDALRDTRRGEPGKPTCYDEIYAALRSPRSSRTPPGEVARRVCAASPSRRASE
jgi:hypothetical protein